MSNELLIRNMSRSEVNDLVDWAAAEGWNPGLHDADLFWATGPGAFIAADLDGELIGGGAITSYGGEFGFMGFFITGVADSVIPSGMPVGTGLSGAWTRERVSGWTAYSRCRTTTPGAD